MFNLKHFNEQIQDHLELIQSIPSVKKYITSFRLINPFNINNLVCLGYI
jgi:hypothetical protein